MAKTAASIPADKLAQLAKRAVRDLEVPTGRFQHTGPIMGFILEAGLKPEAQIEAATSIADATSATARAAGIALRPKPVVVLRPGKIIAGFLTPELNVTVR